MCEISANTAERAAYLLDAALASRSCNRSKNPAEARLRSHMFITLHVYQHKLERKEDGGGVSVHLIYTLYSIIFDHLIYKPDLHFCALWQLKHLDKI